jgi:hypothetical protein
MSPAIAKRFAPAGGSMETRAAVRASAFASFSCHGTLSKGTQTASISPGAALPWQASMTATRRARPGPCRSMSIGAQAIRLSMLYPGFSLGRGAAISFSRRISCTSLPFAGPTSNSTTQSVVSGSQCVNSLPRKSSEGRFTREQLLVAYPGMTIRVRNPYRGLGLQTSSSNGSTRAAADSPRITIIAPNDPRDRCSGAKGIAEYRGGGLKLRNRPEGGLEARTF